MAPKKKRPERRRDKGSGTVYPIRNRRGEIYAYYAALEINGHVERRRAPDEPTAEARLAELRELKRKGIDVGSGTQPLSDWLPTWYKLQVQLGKLKPRSLADYRRMIEQYLIPKLGHIRLADLKQAEIQDFVIGLAAEIRDYYARKSAERVAVGKPPGPLYDGGATTRRAGFVLKMALDLAVTRKLIPETPYVKIELPVTTPRAVEPPTPEQVAAFVRLTEDTRFEALWLIYALLGLRLGEGLGLRWQDYDPVARTLTVRQQVQRMDRHGDTPMHLFTGTPKSGAGERVLPAPLPVCALLDALRPAQMRLRLQRGATWADHDLIFCTRNGTPISPRDMEERWRALWIKAGLPPANVLHDLRKAVATMLDEADATETIKAAILGHTKQTVTQKYVTARVEAMRRVLLKVEQRVLGMAA